MDRVTTDPEKGAKGEAAEARLAASFTKIDGSQLECSP